MFCLPYLLTSVFCTSFSAPSIFQESNGLSISNQAPDDPNRLSMRHAEIVVHPNQLELRATLSQDIPVKPPQGYTVLWELDTDLNPSTGRSQGPFLGIEYNVIAMYSNNAWHTRVDPLPENKRTKGGGPASMKALGNQLTLVISREQIGDPDRMTWRASIPGLSILAPLTATLASFNDKTKIPEDKPRTGIMAVMTADVKMALEPQIKQWYEDMKAEGMTPEEFLISSKTSPRDIKSKLIQAKDRILGAVFIGPVPIAYTVCPSGDDKTNHYNYTPCDNYYQDLDGPYAEGVSRSQLEQYAYFDEPKEVKLNFSGESDSDFRVICDWKRLAKDKQLKQKCLPEIFVGRITAQGLGLNWQNQMLCLRNYFIRNHAYRSGTSPEPHVALYVETISNGDREQALEKAAHGMSFPEYKESKQFVATQQEMADALATPASVFVFTAHGGVALEEDKQFLFDDIKQNPPQFRFMWFNGCGASSYHLEKSIGSTYLLCEGSRALTLVGFPITGGFNFLEKFSEPLNRDGGFASLGGAYLNWYKVNMSRIFLPGYFVFLGDPTLHMR